jgi:hypothetical protein
MLGVTIATGSFAVRLASFFPGTSSAECDDVGQETTRARRSGMSIRPSRTVRYRVLRRVGQLSNMAVQSGTAIPLQVHAFVLPHLLTRIHILSNPPAGDARARQSGRISVLCAHAPGHGRHTPTPYWHVSRNGGSLAWREPRGTIFIVRRWCRVARGGIRAG